MNKGTVVGIGGIGCWLTSLQAQGKEEVEEMVCISPGPPPSWPPTLPSARFEDLRHCPRILRLAVVEGGMLRRDPSCCSQACAVFEAASAFEEERRPFLSQAQVVSGDQV